MFDAVMGRQEQRRRLGTGTAVSVALHAALLGAAVVLPALRPVEVARKDLDRLVMVVSQAPRLGRPDGAPSAPAAARPRRARPARRLHVPSPTPAPTPAPPDAAIPQDGPEEGAETGSGPQTGAGGLGLPTGVPDGLGLGGFETAPPYGPGMTRPVRLAGPDPLYTREALAARVEGVLVVKCEVTTAGEVEGCRVLKGLPYMDEAVVEALTAQRYAPATFQGKPVRVGYVFNVRLKLPR